MSLPRRLTRAILTDVDSVISAGTTLAIKAKEQLLQESTKLGAAAPESCRPAESTLPNWRNADNSRTARLFRGLCQQTHSDGQIHFKKYEDMYLKITLLRMSILN